MSAKKDEEKRQKKNQMIIGITLTLLMIFSVFGIIVNSMGTTEEGETLNYRGLELIDQGSHYQLTIGDYQFYLSENPNTLPKLDYDMNITTTITKYASAPLYIDSTNYQASREIVQNIQGYALRIQEACINEEDCPSEDVPIKTCDDNVIVIRESEENRIYEEQSCVYIEGREEDLLKLTDTFILKILGIN